MLKRWKTEYKKAKAELRARTKAYFAKPPLRQHGAMWFSDSGLFVWDALKKEWIKIDDQAAS
jgi:hypothetical protein